MALHLDLLERPTEPVTRPWTDRDTLLYALAVGAGSADPSLELAYTTENTAGVDQVVVPTFGCLIAASRSPRQLGDFDVARLVHAEQAVRFHSPLAPAGEVRSVSTLTGVHDKGTAALLVQESVAYDPDTHLPLVTSTSTFFVRGEGGFGGSRGPRPPAWERPERQADQEITYTTRADQPLLYRLTGDRNPLHADPSVAHRAGFPRPIMHGMCTYGFTCRALVRGLTDSDPSRLRSMSARFSHPLLPGDTLTVRMWLEDDQALFQALNGAGDVVLDRGRAQVELA